MDYYSKHRTVTPMGWDKLIPAIEKLIELGEFTYEGMQGMPIHLLRNNLFPMCHTTSIRMARTKMRDQRNGIKVSEVKTGTLFYVNDVLVKETTWTHTF